MKLKKILSLALAGLLAAGSFMVNFSVSSADAAPLTIHYSKIEKGNVERAQWVDIDASFNDKDMGAVVKISPIPGTTQNGNALVDGYNIFSLGIDLTRYNYLTVEYKLDSSYSGDIKPYVRLLPGPDKTIRGSAIIRASEDLVRGEWSTYTVNIGNVAKPLLTDGSKNLSQMHFAPFGDLAITLLTPSDVLYIRNFVFTEENPNPDALHTVSFEAGASGATGDAPENIQGKSGDKVILPEIPFALGGNMTAAGWLNEGDGKLYKPGDTYTIGESSASFVVRWREQIVAQDIVELDMFAYQNGICNGADTAKINEVEYEGRKVIELVPNLESAKGGSMIIDGWKYGGAKIDVTAYGTLMVEYKYVSKNPVTGKGNFNIMKQTTFSGMTLQKSREDIVANRWATFSVSLEPARSRVLEGVDPIIMQAHVYPIGENDVKKLDPEDRVYVSKLYVIPELSTGSARHDSYINGYADGTFGVAGNMTRAEACTIVARLVAGGDEYVPEGITSAFSDVSADAWYAKYVAYIESLGYLKSYSGSFEPDKAITRAEFVELVYNMNLLSDNGKNGSFTDVSENHPRAVVISAAGKAGLVNGYDNGDGTFRFNPDATITRAEVVKVINNAYGRTPSAEGIFESSKSIFSDVTAEHWAFADIIDAAVGHLSYLDNDGKEVWVKKFGEEAEEEDFTPDYAKGEAKAAEVEKLIADRISEIRNTPNTEFKDIKGTTYYVSTSGDDSNDGKSENTPFKTAAMANKAAKNGDLVLFKRGDMWRERWGAVAGVTYSAYGEGEKPVFNGNLFGDVADEKYWSLLEGTNNIWEFSEKTTDVGNIIINGGEKTIEKIAPKLVGSGYHISNKPVELRDMFSKNESFVSIYESVSGGNADVNAATAALYVRCDEGNPGKVYKSIEIASRGHIIGAKTNNVFDNIKLVYGGGHGVSMGTVNNVRFQNLEVGFIGGCAQHFSNGVMTRYGNGIEIYGGCNGFYVDNCYIYECYDAGVTHQYSGGGTNSVFHENAFYTNNVIERCIYNIEYFLGKGDNAEAKRIMKNISYKNNILARSGEGWGANPSRSTSIMGWEMSYNEAYDFTIEGNIFYLDKVNACVIGASSGAWLPTFKNNVYIQRYGNTFTKIGANGSTQYKFNGKAAESLEAIGETGFELYYVKG